MAVTEAAVRDALRRVIDPELGINIVDLGLVYRIEVDGACVRVVMTMTSPACPLGGYLQDLVEQTVKWRVRDVQDVEIDIVWEPRWSADMMSDEAEQQLTGGLR